MWVPLVENGEADSDGADYFVQKYVDELLAKDERIDTIILGCTHYPLLLKKIRQYAPPHVNIITQGELVAESLKDYMARHPEMDAKCTQGGSCTYCTTESEEKFSESASIFLNEAVQVKHIDL